MTYSGHFGNTFTLELSSMTWLKFPEILQHLESFWKYKNAMIYPTLSTPGNGAQGSVVLKKIRRCFLFLSRWHREHLLHYHDHYSANLFRDYNVSQVLVKYMDCIWSLSRCILTAAYPYERSLWWILKSMNKSVKKAIQESL